jgi:hypothetical protein
MAHDEGCTNTQTLDPEDTGMIDADRVAELLQTFEEEPMTEKELDGMQPRHSLPQCWHSSHPTLQLFLPTPGTKKQTRSSMKIMLPS